MADHECGGEPRLGWALSRLQNTTNGQQVRRLQAASCAGGYLRQARARIWDMRGAPGQGCTALHPGG